MAVLYFILGITFGCGQVVTWWHLKVHTKTFQVRWIAVTFAVAREDCEGDDWHYKWSVVWEKKKKKNIPLDEKVKWTIRRYAGNIFPVTPLLYSFDWLWNFIFPLTHFSCQIHLRAPKKCVHAELLVSAGKEGRVYFKVKHICIDCICDGWNLSPARARPAQVI